MTEKKDIATFAAGCFWGVEHAFSQVEGVISTKVGYSGGHVENPSYKQVYTGVTGHAETVQVTYDSKRVSYGQLLELFWNCHDPSTLNRQGPDKGTQYRSIIFFHTEQQREAALKSKALLNRSGRYRHAIVTEIVPFEVFYLAEAYHQQYLARFGRQVRVDDK